MGAYRVDKETKKRGVSFKSDPLAQEIIKYNEVDCKVLQEIIYYLRDNHIDPNDDDLEEIFPMDIDSCSDCSDGSNISEEGSDGSNISEVGSDSEDGSNISVEKCETSDSSYSYYSCEISDSDDY